MAVRTDVIFPSGSDYCAAHLYRPAAASGSGPLPHSPFPCVIMAPSFSETRQSLAPHAERFAAAGFAVLLFDYRHFGASAGEPRQLVSVNRQLQDYRAAVSYVRSRADLDRTKIALWGTGFSAGHAMVVGASEGRIAAVVAQAPFIGRADKLFFTQRPWSNLWQNVRGLLRDGWRQLRGELPEGLPVVGLPAGPALFTDPEVQAHFTLRQEEDRHWCNRVVLRSLRALFRYQPGEAARRLTIPLLVCAADYDRLMPPELAVEAARLARRGELRRYPVGHFGLSTGETLQQVVADQVAFLRLRLGLVVDPSPRPLPAISPLRRSVVRVRRPKGIRPTAARPPASTATPEPAGR